MRRTRRGIGVLLVVAMAFSLLACRKPAVASRTDFAMDTVISVTIYEAGDTEVEAVLDRCFAEVKRLEGLFSATLPNSDVARINQAGGTAVTVAEETAELLAESLKYSALSDGAFDVTLRPVIELWDFSGNSGVVDAVLLPHALKTVDYRAMSVDGQTVTLTIGGSIDLGGIAKGYIADRLRELLEQEGVTSAVVDLGGNIVVCGSKNGDDWRVGIKDPADVSSLCAVVTGQNLSVVTSGIYERGFTLDGVRYHHLLSPKTGMPVQNGLASVTIACESSVQADALSTACFVLGESAGLELVRSLDGVEALFVRQDGKMIASEGLAYTPA
ncbi:MAG: FAD:protein FMN transferase [Clostridia bacterium]|nr:FAD:protein FMN transferase [Clostridia bacterium]